jgi:hypothetical protein
MFGGDRSLQFSTCSCMRTTEIVVDDESVEKENFTTVLYSLLFVSDVLSVVSIALFEKAFRIHRCCCCCYSRKLQPGIGAAIRAYVHHVAIDRIIFSSNRNGTSDVSCVPPAPVGFTTPQGSIK